MTPEERKAKKAAYYQRNREKILAKVKAYAEANPKKIAASQKAWRQTHGREWEAGRYDRDKAKRNAASKAYNEKHNARQTQLKRDAYREHPERAYASGVVRVAVARGELVPSCCWVCGAIKVEAHHADYSSPLSVIWLCRRHHRQLHSEV